ncbi:hypothetical protein OKA05_27365 [Luteolibacter arcticus]|uniref:DUF3304 domain-containing protein n=1 Tax=Luteolibacter arcticus TaxID=1581411 RepID=A0ABT3GS51_9BACT|nr:hypothetical protein [Luteolibacter arcticus]MCW1926304.1 hypothetical protein [Luteolibacter arcticus]
MRVSRGGMKRFGSAVVMLAWAGGLGSCGTDYDRERVTLVRGEAHRGYKLTKVERDGVRLARVSTEERDGSTFYSVAGRSHMGGSHSLGNNEHLKILAVDPGAQRAELEFSWLDWVGPLTMPPF